jgi:3-hydroxypropanoate dehydrogenase
MLDDEALNLRFRKARTFSARTSGQVSDALLHELYDLVKWSPTNSNSRPARFVLLRSQKAKGRLRPELAAGIVEKTVVAPVTEIVACNLKFYEKLPKLSPSRRTAADTFARNPQLVENTARRNFSLQGANLILAARALGLGCGPTSGFDNAKVDDAFFGAGKCEDCEQESFPEGHVKSNFLCNLGYGDPFALTSRNPSVEFHEACSSL